MKKIKKLVIVATLAFTLLGGGVGVSAVNQPQVSVEAAAMEPPGPIVCTASRVPICFRMP